MYFDNNFYITLRNCDIYIFHNELFFSENIFPISEDFLIKNFLLHKKSYLVYLFLLLITLYIYYKYFINYIMYFDNNF